ncbi:MAG: carboxypeptidase-like regulatory domain-containing protein [Elainellaceae cyanobacterium]
MAFHLVTLNRIRLIRWLKPGIVFSLAVSLVLATAERSLAHGAVIEYQTTQSLEVQATYDSGEPMANAQVTVYAPENLSEPWLTGMTDDQGRFLFSPDPSMAGNWDVQIRQAGHGDIVSIPIGESDGAIATTVGSSDGSASGGGDVALLNASSSGSTATLNPIQKWTMAGAVIWGLFGTAMFFAARSKQNAHS